MGRPPKTTAEKELSGNPGHRKLTATEPQLGAELPKCPPHLQGEARKAWNRLIKGLANIGLLTVVDRDALAAYCQLYARYLDAEAHLANEELVCETDKGYKYANPWLGISNSALEGMRKLMSEFGFTPASRSRVKIERQSPVDEFEQYLKNR